jgi:hypothetical protein
MEVCPAEIGPGEVNVLGGPAEERGFARPVQNAPGAAGAERLRAGEIRILVAEGRRLAVAPCIPHLRPLSQAVELRSISHGNPPAGRGAAICAEPPDLP